MNASRDRYRAVTAAIAATVSFIHIKSLAVQFGQPLLAALTLPTRPFTA